MNVRQRDLGETETEKRVMYYGKGDVFVYRTYAEPLTEIIPIPESSFTGKDNVIFGMDIQVALKGDAFLTSFTEGDNSLVIATDSMKNFILYHAGEYQGATLEGFLDYVGRAFLERYAHISGVELSGTQFPFKPVDVPGEDGNLVPSATVYREGILEKPYAAVELSRGDNREYVTKSRQSGITDLHLIKVNGSSFAGFIQDEFTTLPETEDRPLFIYLNIYWRYNVLTERYVPAEHIRDIAQTVFHKLDSPSIQKLIFDIGKQILERFPQLAEVSFESNNRTWEVFLEDVPGSSGGKVYTDPRPPYGFQSFTVFPEDVEKDKL